MSIFTKAVTWFTPGRRKAVYGVIALAGAMLLTAGIVAGPLDDWVVFAQSIAGLVFGAMAMIAAKRWDWTVLYLVTGVVSAAAGVTLVTSHTAGTVETLIVQIVTILPPLLATLRTDPGTPTGEPLPEYEARSTPIGQD